MTLVEKAYIFAKEKHQGQFRRDGITPYFTHCEKVASLLNDDKEKAIAYCHDLIEDGKATFEEICDNISASVAEGVKSLSHNKEQDYFTYIKNLDHRFRTIKIADIVANLSDKPTQKQIEKYNKALRILANV